MNQMATTAHRSRTRAIKTVALFYIKGEIMNV
ncbi:hypothetical protein FHS14_004544 [Paenibacillus baekrokdamisoli]|nr:hypothetical protein [Paenibacillus baekrokdamisoli]